MPRTPNVQKQEKRSEQFKEEKKSKRNKKKVMVESESEDSEMESEVSTPVKQGQKHSKVTKKMMKEPTTPISKQKRKGKATQNLAVEIQSGSEMSEDDISTFAQKSVKLQNPPQRKQRKVNPKTPAEREAFPREYMLQHQLMINLVMKMKKTATYDNLINKIQECYYGFTESQLNNLFLMMEQEDDMNDRKGYYMLHQDIIDEIKRKEELERLEQERMEKERQEQELQQRMEEERLEKERQQLELQKQMEMEKMELEKKIEQQRMEIEKSQMEHANNMSNEETPKPRSPHQDMTPVEPPKEPMMTTKEDPFSSKTMNSKLNNMKESMVEEDDKENAQHNIMVNEAC